MILAQLQVLLHLDADEYAADIKKAQRETMKWGEKMERIGKTLTLGVTTPLVGMGLAGVKAASDLSEAVNKVQVVFGAAADEVLRFGRAASSSIGMSSREALEAAGTFGNLFTSMGMGRREAAQMSMSLVQLAADLASFNNLDPTDVLEKLRSGLVGEVEPLRSLGVQLSQAAVMAKAMEMGLADANGQVSQAALIQARYALILEQTKNAQGDFARTSNGLANEMRTFKARAEDAAAALGQALLPTAIDVVGVVNDLLGEFNALPESTKKAVVEIGGLAAAAGPAATVVGRLAQALSKLSESAAAAGGWLAWGKTLGASVGAVGAYTAALVSLFAVVREGAQFSAKLRAAEASWAAYREQIRYTADSYDDYVAAAIRAYKATHKIAPSQEEIVRLLRAGGDVAARWRTELGLVTAEEWAHERALVEEARSYDRAMLASASYAYALGTQRKEQQAATHAVQEAAAMTQAYQQKLDLLQQAIQGPLGQAYDDYAQKVGDLRERMAEVRQEIDMLAQKEAQGTLWGQDKQRLADLRMEYAGLQTELDNTTAAYERQRNMILYNIASKMLLQSVEQGLIKDMNNSGSAIDEVYAALTSLAQGLGLVDDKTASTQEAIGRLVDAYAQGKLSAETFAKYVAELGSELDGLPRKVNVDIEIATHGSIPRLPSGGRIGYIPQAKGGDWLVRKPTLFLAGEAGPERATFTPLGRAPGAAMQARAERPVVVQVTYAPTVSLADEAEMERVLGPFVASKVRDALTEAA